MLVGLLVLLDEVLVLVLVGLLVLVDVEVLVDELPDPVVVLVLVPVLGDEGYRSTFGGCSLFSPSAPSVESKAAFHSPFP